ncbi:hypothetical protein F2P81_024111 [Scophthalmus maximus]|uniref:40S ribosomal protein S12 n=17 Tax=Clupeocephala TaxID=186625 RepID=A0A6A4RWM8_SCOMX|nr:hypothetical protein F2P81_024111 [Scophthalmus maximus]
MEKFSENEAATFAFPDVSFDQKGSYFCEYQKKMPSNVINYPQGNPAELSVSVKLEKPSISLTSPHVMVIYSPDEISVTQGNRFSITCSTHSKYPGGVFYLKKSEMNTTDMKPTFGHSVFYLAYFEFLAIDFKDQGEYSCVYAVNLSSIYFSSVPSRSIHVTVVATSSSSVITGIVVSLVVLLIVLVVCYLVWRRRWRGIGTMVQFNNRSGGAIKQDMEDRSNGALNGRQATTGGMAVRQVGVPMQADSGVTDRVADMPVKVFYSSASGSMETKKRQERLFSVLTSKNIPFEPVDICQNLEERDLMREKAGNSAALAPQICNGDVYCGNFKSPIHQKSTMAEEGIAAGGVMDVNTALPEVLKTALIHDGLARGIREAAKALDKRQAHLCVLAANCDEPMYVKLVEALCAEHQINLIKVDDNKKLGEWVGLCKIDREGKPRKVVGCSCVVVKDYGKESQAKDVIEEYFKSKK